jgi:hypothetical protein
MTVSIATIPRMHTTTMATMTMCRVKAMVTTITTTMT